ncbi:unnamed protein product [Spodoptera exigua]|nr:unnamed protein product [Spodoptera exigua]
MGREKCRDKNIWILSEKLVLYEVSYYSIIMLLISF